MTIARNYLYLMVALGLIFTQPLTWVHAQGGSQFANCRLGVGGIGNDVTGYNMGQLHLGRYLDWGTQNPRPTGLAAEIEFIQVVRVHQNKPDYGSGRFGPPRVYLSPPSYWTRPSLTQIATIAQSQPGMVWLIGNEIERVDWSNGNGTYGGQDEITPELYATAYHDIRQTIKTADPTARVGIGGVIQATPLRLVYLDRVWNSYASQYGHSLGQDVDVWNVHGFVIREVLNDWGAEIPAGLNNHDSDPSNNYNPADAFLSNANYQTVLNAHHDINYYRQFIQAFRAWMAAHGERHKPLLNSEYGILMSLDNPAVINFLHATFDYMFSATDASTGYPLDENRLLQGWVWYSLNDNNTPFQQGTLFNTSKNLTAVGNAWKSYVTNPAKPLASQARRNLLVANLSTTPSLAFVSPGQTANVSLKVTVANSGNTKTSTGNNLVVKFWNGVPHAPGSGVITSQSLADLPGCGHFKTITVTWPNRPVGTYTWYAEAVPLANETNPGDNIGSSSFKVVVGQARFLPLILKN